MVQHAEAMETLRMERWAGRDCRAGGIEFRFGASACPRGGATAEQPGPSVQSERGYAAADCTRRVLCWRSGTGGSGRPAVQWRAGNCGPATAIDGAGKPVARRRHWSALRSTAPRSATYPSEPGRRPASRANAAGRFSRHQPAAPWLRAAHHDADDPHWRQGDSRQCPVQPIARQPEGGWQRRGFDRVPLSALDVLRRSL